MLAAKERIVNRREFITHSLGSKRIEMRSPAINGNATPRNPKVSPVKRFMPLSRIDAMRPPIPEIANEMQMRER
jgi:hypothetical protein